MLSREENEMITRVGAETPMGELFRRFWAPILMARELEEPDGPPMRIKLLGEFLVAFRDTQGRLGLLDARCPHRGFDLSMGINEDNGLRCYRCLWKFTVDGTCVDTPMEPEDSDLKNHVKVQSYLLEERGGLLWAYLGPREDIPDIPEFEWTHIPETYRYCSRFLVECNYLQGVEGGMDAGRIEWLEEMLSGRVPEGGQSGLSEPDDLSRVDCVATPYGLQISATGGPLINDSGVIGTSDVHTIHWLMPFYTTGLAEPNGILNGLAWVPMDDENTMAFGVTYHPSRKLTSKERKECERGARVHPPMTPGTFVRKRNKDNGYVGDGDPEPMDFLSRFNTTLERSVALQESMGRIVDRTEENLGENDIAVDQARRQLLKAAIDLREGVDPSAARDPDAYRVRSFRSVRKLKTAPSQDPDIQEGVRAKV